MTKSLDSKKIKKHIFADVTGVCIFDTIDSTNSYGKEYLLCGKPSPALILAEEQTNGRGRCGRSFYSPQSTGLYMSIVYTADNYSEDALSATVSAGVASALAIEELSGKDVQIKWVNDIYIDGKKAGGILCESVFTDGKMGIIVGIGINISTDNFPVFENNVPTSTGEIDRNALAGKIYDLFFKFNSDKGVCLDEYRKRFYLLNKEIIIYRADGTEDIATARGIDDNGGLIVELDGKREIIRTGEVTVREK